MPQRFLWVEDAVCQEQACGNSARQWQARMRSHVQSHRTTHAAKYNRETALIPDRTNRLQPFDCRKGVPASSLRPSRSLGRLAAKPSKDDCRRKRRKNTSSKPPGPKNVTSTDRTAVLVRSLPFLWHGLTSSERSSLIFFQLRTSQEWSGWEDSHYWNTLALQVSQQSQTVARSLTAISALHEQVGSRERALLQSLSSEQSSKATTTLISKPEVSYLEALVSCLIMICFHGLQHSRAPFVLLRSGLNLLAECNDPRHASLEEQQIVDLQLRPLFIRLLARPCSMVDMPKAFILSIEGHRAKAVTIKAEKPSVPCTYNALPAARKCLRDIFDWAHDNHPFSENPKSSMHCFLHELHQLCSAWQTSLAASQFPNTTSSIKAQSLLKAACVVGMIIVNTAHYAEECVFDKYQTHFEEILFLVGGAWSFNHSFGIDAGLFDMISFVGLKSRDPHIRRKALRFLKSGDRLEGDRVVANPATILEALIALEERHLEVATCYDIPEQNRLHLVCGQQYISQGRIDLFYASSDESRKERCCFSLARPANIGRRKRFDRETDDVPDAIFGTGYAAYLEDRETMNFFRIEMERFFFPIPRS